MNHERLLAAIQQLLTAARREAEFDAQGSPAWFLDQSLAAIDVLVEMEHAIRERRLGVGPGFSFRDRLGGDWVDASDLGDLVESIDVELHRSASDA